MKSNSIVLCGVFLFVGLGLATAHAASADDAATISGTWSLNNWTSGESVRLKLGYRKGGTRWQWGSDQLLADLHGLNVDQLHAAHTAVNFTMDRDAGQFARNPTYVAKLNMLGYECKAEDDASVMYMAVRNISLEYAAEAKLSGLKDVTVKDLTRLLDRDVSLDSIRELAALGYASRFSADDVVALRDHGVEPGYVARVQSSGYPNLTVDEIIKLHDHGVD